MYEKFLSKYGEDFKHLFDAPIHYFYSSIIKEDLLKDDEYINHIINSINLSN